MLWPCRGGFLFWRSPLQVTKAPKESGVGTRLPRRIAAEARLAGQAAQLPGSLSGAMAGTTVIGGAVTNHRRKNEHTHHPLSFRHNNRFGHRIAIARPPNTATHASA